VADQRHENATGQGEDFRQQVQQPVDTSDSKPGPAIDNYWAGWAGWGGILWGWFLVEGLGLSLGEVAGK
jgi:hypothetical protein